MNVELNAQEMFVVAGRGAGLSAPHTAADLPGCSPPSPPAPGFTQDGTNKRKHPASGSLAQRKCHVDFRGQRSERVVWCYTGSQEQHLRQHSNVS